MMDIRLHRNVIFILVYILVYNWVLGRLPHAYLYRSRAHLFPKILFDLDSTNMLFLMLCMIRLLRDESHQGITDFLVFIPLGECSRR